MLDTTPVTREITRLIATGRQDADTRHISRRAFLRAELEAMLDVIAEEREALKPLLLRRDPPPPESAIALHRLLARMSRETREMLFAMRDAESATQH
jgi:hypothetical protein